ENHETLVPTSQTIYHLVIHASRYEPAINSSGANQAVNLVPVIGLRSANKSQRCIEFKQFLLRTVHHRKIDGIEWVCFRVTDETDLVEILVVLRKAPACQSPRSVMRNIAKACC